MSASDSLPSKSTRSRLGAVRASLALAALPVALALTACHDEPQAAPTTNSAAGPMNSMDPHSGLNRKVDAPPLAIKMNAAQLCVYDTYSFRDARAAYLGSLGGAEPSADKLPDFGQTLPDAATPPPSPSASAGPAAGSAAPKAPPSAAPKVTPAKSSAPSASAGPSSGPSATPVAPPAASSSGKPMPDRRLTGIRYAQYTKQCSLLLNMKEPDGGQLDTVVAEYAPFAAELGKNLTEASMYYQQELYKNDAFAKGKELHAKLVEAFGKLDDLQARMLGALRDFEQKQPIDKSAWTESQKLSNAFATAAVAFFMDVNGPKLDWKTAKDDLAKVDEALKALQAFKSGKDEGGKDRAGDPFVKLVLVPAEQFAQQAHATFDAGKDKDRIVPAEGIALTNFIDRVLMNDHSAMLLSIGASPGVFPDKMRPRVPGGRPGMPRIRPQAPGQQ